MTPFVVEMIKVELLKPATYNPRKRLRPSDKAYQDIKRAIGQFGLVQNLVWNKRSGNLVAGHQRLAVGRREFAWTEAPCCVVDLPPNEERALNVILNRVGEGLWSTTKLADLLTELREVPGFDLTDLGFDESELDALLKKPAPKTKRDPDTAPAPPRNPRTKPGDIYHIISSDGHPEHRLICGSCHDRETWEKLLGDSRPALYFSDPPYGVGYESKAAKAKGATATIQDDRLRQTALEEFLLPTFRLAHEFTGADAAIYCFFATRHHIAVEQSLRRAEWEPTQELIWAKQMVLGRANYHWAHEPLFYGHKIKRENRWYFDRTQTTIWQDDRPDFKGMTKADLVELLTALADAQTVWDEKRDPPSSYIHPAQKPVSLVQRAMRHSTLPRDSTVDSWGRAGSTMIGGQLAGRATFTIEDAPAFCDAIITRYVETFRDCLLYLNGEEIAPATFQTILA